MTIYFIQDEKEGAIKVGFTSASAERRMAQLQTGRQFRLTLLGTIPGTIQDERSIHKEFSDFAMEGEWFRPALDVILTINDLIKNQHPWFHCRNIRSKFSFKKLESEWALHLQPTANTDLSAHEDTAYSGNVDQVVEQFRDNDQLYRLVKSVMIWGEKSKIPDEIPKWALSRIGEETDRRRQAVQRVQELEQLLHINRIVFDAAQPARVR